MKKITVALLLACTFMTGCAGETPEASQASPSEVEAPSASNPAPQPSEPTAPSAPAPAAEETGPDSTAVLAALAQIDARLAADPERVLRRLDNICLDIQQGKDEATIVASAESRLEGGDIPDLTAEQALQVVTVARSIYCQ